MTNFQSIAHKMLSLTTGKYLLIRDSALEVIFQVATLIRPHSNSNSGWKVSLPLLFNFGGIVMLNLIRMTNHGFISQCQASKKTKI